MFILITIVFNFLRRQIVKNRTHFKNLEQVKTPIFAGTLGFFIQIVPVFGRTELLLSMII